MEMLALNNCPNIYKSINYLISISLCVISKSVKTLLSVLFLLLFGLHADLKLVLQLSHVFHYYGRTISEDVRDLLDGKQALLPQEQHCMFYCLHRHSQDLGVMGHHSLKTA